MKEKTQMDKEIETKEQTYTRIKTHVEKETKSNKLNKK